MAVLLNNTFDAGLDGWSAGTHRTNQGNGTLGGTDGCLEIGASTSSYRDFTGITTGKVRFDIRFKLTDVVNAANAGHFIYLLPNGATVSSANTLGVVLLDRSTSPASTTQIDVSYRVPAGSFISFSIPLKKVAYWYKLSMIADIAAKTTDIYIDDICVVRKIAWSNSSATNAGRVAIASAASAPATWFDDIVVESGWTENESVLIDQDFVGGSGNITSTIPTTAGREAHGQPWVAPRDTSLYDSFNLGPDGAAPVAGKICSAYQRCAVDGIIECEFKTSVSGAAYFGLHFRFWDYPTATGAGAGLFRLYGASTNVYTLFLPDRSGNLIVAATGSATPAANTIYTLKLEKRGRVLEGSIKAATMDAGTYQLLFTHTVTSSATGGRGMLSEEIAGPVIATTLGATDNYVRRFRFTGKALPGETTKTIGAYKTSLSHGSLRELYHLEGAEPTRNLYWSKGIQWGHRSTADQNGAIQQQTIYDAANVFSVRQYGSNMSEYEHIGYADVYCTLLRRGPWISDHVHPFTTSENFAPDWDFRPELTTEEAYACLSSGAATLYNENGSTWVPYGTNIAPAFGAQAISSFGSGSQLRQSEIIVADTNTAVASWFGGSGNELGGNPITRAFAIPPESLTANTDYRIVRAFLFESASALSGTALTDWRLDAASHGTLTMTTGTRKTDAAGDNNADGFNERHGWYEVQCSGGAAAFTLPVGSGKRHYPAFRLHGRTNTDTDLTINGAAAIEGLDYVLDDLGGGVGLLQILSIRSADTAFAMTVAPSVMSAVNQSGIGSQTTGTLTQVHTLAAANQAGSGSQTTGALSVGGGGGVELVAQNQSGIGSQTTGTLTQVHTLAAANQAGSGSQTTGALRGAGLGIIINPQIRPATARAA